MPQPDRALAERVLAIVRAAAHLVPRAWYGMPAYSKDGNVVCFFQPASKTAADEARVAALVQKAVS